MTNLILETCGDSFVMCCNFNYKLEKIQNKKSNNFFFQMKSLIIPFTSLQSYACK